MLRRALRRLRANEGFGLVELLIAMIILNIGLIAIVAAFAAGTNAIRRSSRISTASSIADAQLELYRALTYPAIALDTTAVNGTDAVYRGDAALPGGDIGNLITTATGCGGLPNQCNPSRSQNGPDGGSYRIDTYIVSKTPTGGRPVKLVTVVVRDATNLTGLPWVRQSSSFDAATGT